MASDWYEEMEKAEQEYDAREYELAQEYLRGYEQGRADKEKELSELPNPYSEKLWENAYNRGRANAIDECIKLVGGNTKTIVGIVFDNSIPIHDRALGRMAKNKLIEELVEQLEQLKEQKNG